MKITRSLSRKRDCSGRSEVLLRLTVDHYRQYRLKSGIFVERHWWCGDRMEAPRRERLQAAECAERLARLERRIYAVCASAPRELLSADYVRAQSGLGIHAETKSAAAWAKDYAAGRRLSVARRRQYATLARMIVRFEKHTAATGINAWDSSRVAEFVEFLRTEHEHDALQPMRGHNTLCSVVARLRAVLRFAAAQSGIGMRMPKSCEFLHSEVYGTPFYLEAPEVEAVATFDLSENPRLAAQRDAFVFQCLTGVRVSDLSRLSPENVVGGVLEFVATKTRHLRPTSVRVPLHSLAQLIVERYAGADARGRLLPVASPARYNRAIREVLHQAGITRAVAVLDPVTQLERMRPIAEVAGSHLARRTFVGNLYRQVKDPCLVGTMSGHKDGSKAFARYRRIDDGMKRELIEQTFCRQI